MKEQITKARKATKSIFLVCGLGISSWAPMVPYAKERLGLNNADLGLLLLLLGGGAISMMPVSGILAHRYGTRIVIRYAALIMALTLPLLLLISSPVWMGLALFIFGSAVGVVDVAMNSHGVQVQNASDKPIMSALHGLFSVGGLFGSLGLGFLMKAGLSPVTAAICIAVLLVGIVFWNYRFLLDDRKEKELIRQFSVSAKDQNVKSFSWLKASVLFLGLMCFSSFLSEGAMLDWSAVFLSENKGVNPELAGVGYACFSVAMAIMRLLGDGIVSRLAGKTVVTVGAIIAASGLFLAVFSPWVFASLLGFVLLGIGAANIVPVFFSEGGRLKDVPATIAIPVISTMGYAGQLAGPALLGFIAYHFSLNAAFLFIAGLLLMVAITYGLRKQKAG
ncbi:MFS transporter [Pedobacter nutrimenti]|uniref:Fucose permease n=1 Tax=Pedobacter nutrimenti TaxID=1241337 RepID=A0A318UH62_9SPHI|nr:MFS transporter [Pedobacter nutrimenti]PYF74870.1 fucose permease [Pedobacter nutrimenti]